MDKAQDIKGQAKDKKTLGMRDGGHRINEVESGTRLKGQKTRKQQENGQGEASRDKIQ